MAEVPLEACLVETAPPPAYQRIARRASHLNDLGLDHSAIARRLGYSDKTIARAIIWIQQA